MDLNYQDIQYAIENTHILYEPVRRIDTFGETRFEFVFITEPMESCEETIVRSGWLEAERPKIIKPQIMQEVDLEGFSEDAKRFFAWMTAKKGKNVILQYGFQFKLTDVSVERLHEPKAQVEQRLLDDMNERDEPGEILLTGIESGWESGLLKFSTDMIIKSVDINLFDLNRHGLL